MRLSSPAAALAAVLLTVSPLVLGHAAMAQIAPKSAPNADHAAGKTKPTNPNPVIASVNGEPIHLDDVRVAAQSLPEQARSLPPNMLFPMVVNQVIDEKALLIAAHNEGLQKDPQVKQVMQSAADSALQNVYLTRKIGPEVNDDAVQALYAKTVASKPGEEEVHARHILVPTEAQAKSVIKKLDAGADFAKLATSLSTDKASAAQNGGDLGWFKRGDMLPAFSDAAFSLKPGQTTQKPVHTQYGWHVIQVLGTRTAPPPPFATVKDQLRQQLIQQKVRGVVQTALADVKVVRYKPDGSKVTAADETPPAGAAPKTH
ncbi:peptidylprolyl isomerase [Lichenicoccus sp.]|uniref:peptidylprolyl isomerase n=1 Tax=Lichenicoccus sp. TaxID=2781899 RepID=UPI003D130DDF